MSSSSTLCSGTTSAGAPCGNRVRAPGLLCWRHDGSDKAVPALEREAHGPAARTERKEALHPRKPAARCAGLTKENAPCKLAAGESGYCWRHCDPAAAGAASGREEPTDVGARRRAPSAGDDTPLYGLADDEDASDTTLKHKRTLRRPNIWKRREAVWAQNGAGDLYGDLPSDVVCRPNSGTWSLHDGAPIKVEVDHMAEVAILDCGFFELARGAEQPEPVVAAVVDVLNGDWNLNVTSQLLNGSKGQVFRAHRKHIDWDDADAKFPLVQLFEDIKCHSGQRAVKRQVSARLSASLIEFRRQIRDLEAEYPRLEEFDRQLTRMFDKLMVHG
jgi:hypothetical protein